MTNTYEIRPYESGDRAGVLSLYELVFGESMGTDWFTWKYENNPHVDHVPILLATADGRIVGARPFFALNMSCNQTHDVVLQPCDAMVHPDHRRRGLFTRLTERAIDRYRDDCRYFFNFPNHRSLPGNLELGWRKVSDRVFYYRIENPGRLLAARSDRTSVRLAGRFGTVLAGVYYRLRDTLASSPDVSIREESVVPVDELTSLYRRSVPDGIHVVRDEPFYEWRFENPEWNYTTYLAETEKGVKAALVTGTSTGSGPNKTIFADTVPLQAAPENRDVRAALVERVLADHTDTDLFCTPAQGISESVLRSFGFHGDDTLPLSLLNTQTTHVVRALTEEWEVDGVDLTDSDNWLLTFAEHDTS